MIKKFNNSHENTFREIEKKMSQLFLCEKIKLIGGRKLFYTQRIRRLGIKSMFMADGTMGINIRRNSLTRSKRKRLKKSVAYPCTILLASTWNRELAFAYAQSIGKECRAAKIDILLGPGINIYRSSTCGRNFEYFGEDPYLAGELTASYVKGLQSTGVMATLKHFVANNSEYFRRKSNSVVDERTLHEIYMPAFKKGIEAGAAAVMTSYNLLNGEWCGQSKYAIDELLRQHLGFKGLVMTDWWSVYDGQKVILSGQDLEMPFRLATLNAKMLVKRRKIDKEHIERMVKHQLNFYQSSNVCNKTKTKKFGRREYKEAEGVALQTAREGIVLLKNEKNILPISGTNTKKILIVGEFINCLASGGGAAYVEGYNQLALKEALEERCKQEVVCENNPNQEQISNAEIIILSVGTYDAETLDRSFELPKKQLKLIDVCVNHNTNVIVVINAGGGVKLTPWCKKAAAILYGWYWGQNGAIAAVEIIMGKVNPSSKLPISIEKDFKDSPAHSSLPINHDSLSKYDPDQEDAMDVFDIPYHEGVYVGYRWYLTKKIDPLYPFGFGLSYTEFKVHDENIDKNEFHRDDKLVVSMKVKNIGARYGAEVIQLYIRDIISSIERPLWELKQFKKIFLSPDQEKEVCFELTVLDFSFWSPTSETWQAEEGEFEILIGNSSKNIYKSFSVRYNFDF